MTVCYYFLEGRCRFGQNCRFEHSFNNDDKNTRGSVNSQPLNYKQIVAEVIIAEKGNQWPLSCFGPVKGGANVLGLEDVSPEEVRWKMYEARANGTLNQCQQEINQLYNNAKKIRNMIKDSTMERVIINALKGKNEMPNSSDTFTGVPSSTNIFGSSKQFGGTQNIFSAASNTGSHGSIFGGSTVPSGNIFGGSSQQSGSNFGGSTGFSSQNIFGGSGSSSAFPSTQNSNQNFLSNSSSPGGSIFSNTPISSKNIFSKPGENNNQNVSNAFISTNNSQIFQNQPSSAPFGSNSTFFQSDNSKNQYQPLTFGASQNENIFSKPNNVFNSPQESSKTGFGAPQKNPFTSNQQVGKEFDSSIYSKVEDLTEEEIKSFTSATFAFGKIPLKPPPVEYCK